MVLDGRGKGTQDLDVLALLRVGVDRKLDYLPLVVQHVLDHAGKNS